MTEGVTCAVDPPVRGTGDVALCSVEPQFPLELYFAF